MLSVRVRSLVSLAPIETSVPMQVWPRVSHYPPYRPSFEWPLHTTSFLPLCVGTPPHTPSWETQVSQYKFLSPEFLMSHSLTPTSSPRTLSSRFARSHGDVQLSVSLRFSFLTLSFLQSPLTLQQRFQSRHPHQSCADTCSNSLASPSPACLAGEPQTQLPHYAAVLQHSCSIKCMTTKLRSVLSTARQASLFP